MDARPERTVIKYAHIQVEINYQNSTLMIIENDGHEITMPFAAIPELLAALTAMGRQVPNTLQGAYHKTR